jgi:hypothetical protein
MGLLLGQCLLLTTAAAAVVVGQGYQFGDVAAAQPRDKRQAAAGRSNVQVRKGGWILLYIPSSQYVGPRKY